MFIVVLTKRLKNPHGTTITSGDGNTIHSFAACDTWPLFNLGATSAIASSPRSSNFLSCLKDLGTSGTYFSKTGGHLNLKDDLTVFRLGINSMKNTRTCVHKFVNTSIFSLNFYSQVL